VQIRPLIRPCRMSLVMPLPLYPEKKNRIEREKKQDKENRSIAFIHSFTPLCSHSTG